MDLAGKYTIMFVVSDKKGERTFGMMWVGKNDAENSEKALVTVLRIVAKQPEIWKDVDTHTAFVRVRLPDSDEATNYPWPEARKLWEATIS